MKELIVKTGNRKLLDATLQPLGGLVSEYPNAEGNYIVRAVPPEKIGFLAFAIKSQGYAEIIQEVA